MVVKSWYNGYSPKERDAKYKVLKKLIASGDLFQAKGPCDLCNDPEVSVEYHDEDYGLPYLWTKPALLSLCRHCHRYKLHKRFNNPENWYIFLAHIRRGGYASELKNKDIAKELKSLQIAQQNNVNFELKVIRPYQHAVGTEWFASIRMDIESLQDPKARPREALRVKKTLVMIKYLLPATLSNAILFYFIARKNCDPYRECVLGLDGGELVFILQWIIVLCSLIYLKKMITFFRKKL